MSCYHPWTAYQLTTGEISFVERGAVQRTLTLPCNQCVGCSLDRSRQWAIRCMHEAQMHGDENSFVTLTYSDENLPAFNNLEYRDFQLFMKRLRRKHARPIRFYMAGEYGEIFGRPHFHACLFGVRFDDRVYLGKSPAGFKLYRSGVLESVWPHGYASVGDVSFESAAYVARYIMKKRLTSQKGESAYEVIDPDSGEVVRRVAEFNRMSLRPGIGASWLANFRSDVYPHGKVVVDGVEVNAPRYYDKLFEADDAERFEALAYKRDVAARAAFADNVDARLAVKEEVKLAAIRSLKRTF